ncbi:unnamed protein product [Dovyalis caffra]|uniref:Cytochrome P450 n=1 Tax=Dovyalis caffra TaxID=77055 RepID=A0AAV1R1J6_9ROSI|nr:unnamed protein product [Dovyalis caffra]
MRSQGMKGPPYRFLHGNTKEIYNMRNEIMSSPMELSHQMLARIQPHVYSWIKLYGMNFLSWYGPRAQLVITEPELIKEVLSNKDGAYPKLVIQNYAEKLLGDGLVLSQGKKWLKMRKLANHAFHADSLKGMIPAMIASVETMLDRWRQYGVKEIEVFQEFKVLTSEIISRAALGSSYLEAKNIFDMLTRMALIVGRNNYKVGISGIKKFFKTRDDIESEKLDQGIRDSILKVIEKRGGDDGTEPASYGSDFLGLLLKAHHENDKTRKISIDDLIDECKTFYVAGHETTTSSLTWTVLFLAIHTDWQDRAREEVFQLFGQQNPCPDSIGRLKTMTMIVNESLRLYPPVFNLTREVQKEVKLGKLIVPAKTTVCLSVLALHNNPQIWGEDAHLFKPERFADGVVKAAKNNVTAFLPFGLGPRSCVGLNFALSEIKIALSMILQHYRLTLSPTYVHSPRHILTISPQYGLQILLEAL